MMKSGVLEFAVGGQHGCARDDTSLMCWGHNGIGQVGDPALFGVVDVPTAISIAAPITAIAAGDGHTCAITEGVLRCWGANFEGQLGDGTTMTRRAPTLIPVARPAKLALGGAHSCATDVKGVVWCWGAGASGQLGVAGEVQSSDPVEVLHPGGGTFGQLVAGRAHTCALDTTSTMFCWGNNGAGQLGSPGPNATTPRQVDWPGAAGDIHQIFVRHDTTCATRFNGEARCWGEDGYGAIGPGGAVPRPFGDIAEIESFGGGYSTLCARTTTGELWCAGAGDRGQLGADLLGWSPAVVPVPCE
jgi:alpha-tubulin suppressor-like RCC1 family protein